MTQGTYNGMYLMVSLLNHHGIHFGNLVFKSHCLNKLDVMYQVLTCQYCQGFNGESQLCMYSAYISIGVAGSNFSNCILLSVLMESQSPYGLHLLTSSVLTSPKWKWSEVDDNGEGGEMTPWTTGGLEVDSTRMDGGV